MERVKYTPCFRPGAKTDIFRKVRIVVILYYSIVVVLPIVFVFIGLITILAIVAAIAMSIKLMMHRDLTESEGPVEEGEPPIVTYIKVLLFVEFGFMFTLVWYMRHYIREKYSITGSYVQDCICAFFCRQCAIAQMMRHTADYDTYVSKCCTPTGVPNHAPSIV
jgi:Cys-rich protein (TIGR01571 family)